MSKEIEKLESFVRGSIDFLDQERIIYLKSKVEMKNIIEQKADGRVITNLFASQSNEPNLKQVSWPFESFEKINLRNGITGSPLSSFCKFDLLEDGDSEDDEKNERHIRHFEQEFYMRMSILKKAMEKDESIVLLVRYDIRSMSIEIQFVPVYFGELNSEFFVSFLYNEMSQFLRSRYAYELVRIEDEINMLAKKRKNAKRALDRENYFLSDSDKLFNLSQVEEVVLGNKKLK